MGGKRKWSSKCEERTERLDCAANIFSRALTCKAALSYCVADGSPISAAHAPSVHAAFLKETTQEAKINLPGSRRERPAALGASRGCSFMEGQIVCSLHSCAMSRNTTLFVESIVVSERTAIRRTRRRFSYSVMVYSYQVAIVSRLSRGGVVGFKFICGSCTFNISAEKAFVRYIEDREVDLSEQLHVPRLFLNRSIVTINPPLPKVQKRMAQGAATPE